MYGEDDKELADLLSAAGLAESVVKVTIYEGVHPLTHDPITVTVKDFGQSKTIGGKRFHIRVRQSGMVHQSVEGEGSSLKGIINTLGEFRA